MIAPASQFLFLAEHFRTADRPPPRLPPSPPFPLRFTLFPKITRPGPAVYESGTSHSNQHTCGQTIYRSAAAAHRLHKHQHRDHLTSRLRGPSLTERLRPTHTIPPPSRYRILSSCFVTLPQADRARPSTSRTSENEEWEIHPSQPNDRDST